MRSPPRSADTIAAADADDADAADAKEEEEEEEEVAGALPPPLLPTGVALKGRPRLSLPRLLPELLLMLPMLPSSKASALVSYPLPPKPPPRPLLPLPLFISVEGGTVRASGASLNIRARFWGCITLPAQSRSPVASEPTALS